MSQGGHTCGGVAPLPREYSQLLHVKELGVGWGETWHPLTLPENAIREMSEKETQFLAQRSLGGTALPQPT